MHMLQTRLCERVLCGQVTPILPSRQRIRCANRHTHHTSHKSTHKSTHKSQQHSLTSPRHLVQSFKLNNNADVQASQTANRVSHVMLHASSTHAHATD